MPPPRAFPLTLFFSSARVHHLRRAPDPEHRGWKLLPWFSAATLSVLTAFIIEKEKKVFNVSGAGDSAFGTSSSAHSGLRDPFAWGGQCVPSPFARFACATMAHTSAYRDVCVCVCVFVFARVYVCTCACV